MNWERKTELWGLNSVAKEYVHELRSGRAVTSTIFSGLWGFNSQFV